MAVLTAACGSDEANPGPEITRPTPEGDPRVTRLGFGALPPEGTNDAYANSFATAATYADLVLIQRAPPWADFLPGAEISEATKETTRFENALLDQYGDLQRFFAIDPTDGSVQRTRIANLPAGVDATEGFESPDLRRAFLEYTAYIATNYEPDYLAIGVEINMLYERDQGQFEAFVTLYREAYDVAKAASPSTKVFPTFQLEDLEGALGDLHPPHWEVVDYFRDRMDVLAISTYPFLGGVRNAASLRADHFSQLNSRYEGEIIIAETAWPSSPVPGSGVVGTPEDQAAYLDRLIAEAGRNRFGAVVWLAPLDPASAGATFRTVGLRQGNGANKPGWATWEAWARRPLDP